MYKRKESTEKKYQEIFKRYQVLYDEQYLRHSRCIELLSKEFYMGDEAIVKIVQEGKRKNKSNPEPQHNLN